MNFSTVTHKGIVDGNVPLLSACIRALSSIVPRHLAGGYGGQCARLRQVALAGRCYASRNAKRQAHRRRKSPQLLTFPPPLQRNHFSITFVHHRVCFSNAVFHAERVKRKTTHHSRSRGRACASTGRSPLSGPITMPAAQRNRELRARTASDALARYRQGSRSL